MGIRKVTFGKTIKASYLPQANDDYFSSDKSIVEWIAEAYGINDETIKEVLIDDGVISGSFICMNKDFEKQIMKLKNSITQ